MTLLNTNDYPQCKTSNSTSCEENKRQFKIIETSPEDRRYLIKIKVDGCMYTDKDMTKRCDYIFELQDKFSCFIELKGKDIKHAVEQLESSLKNIAVQGKKYAFVVSSQVPKISISQKTILSFKKKYNAKFEIKNTRMEKAINDLL
ncbi:MAG: hypothetical protein LW807_01095 [Proteobacteria bacterium]|jgi:hypothetical protein|nr:hypothetical protein [Pseudomonadota bacterium]